jgi:hypothetical protein
MKEIKAIYKAVKTLSNRYPGRKFTPDGILVGTLGEVLAAEKYTLDLLPPKTKAFDAEDRQGRKVQIRCNQRSTAPIKKGATKGMFLALKLLPDGDIKEIFNGPAAVAHRLTKDRKADASGFVGLSHNKLRNLMNEVPAEDRIPPRRRNPKSRRSKNC